MNKLLPKMMMTVLVGGLFHATSAATKESFIAERAARIRVTDGPAIERVDPRFAIVKWTSETPRGSPAHFGIVRYGTEPTNLNRTVKSPIRLNPGHSHTVFRVRLEGLNPRTTYYYAVDSMDANGKSDGVKRSVKHFTTR
jgi:phosphodiesterase/alkaline phosphatase D-like protein